jgi:Spy/CpxP family protein refolding chaperone
MKQKTVLIGFLCIIFMFSVLQARDGENLSRPNRFVRYLELSEDQQNQINDLHLQLEKELIPLKSEIEKLRNEMKLEMTAEKFNESKVKDLNDGISNLQKEIKLKHLLYRRAVRDLLTPEQQKKFDMQLLSDKRGKLGRRAGMNRGPRSPRGIPDPPTE